MRFCHLDLDRGFGRLATVAHMVNRDLEQLFFATDTCPQVVTPKRTDLVESQGRMRWCQHASNCSLEDGGYLW